MKIPRFLRFLFRDKAISSDHDTVPISCSTKQCSGVSEQVSRFDREFIAFHGTSLWAANNIFESRISNMLDDRGIREEVVNAVEILGSNSEHNCVRRVISDCAKMKGICVPIGFDDAILGICNSDENRMLSYGSLYVSFRLDVAIEYALNGPEVRRILGFLIDLSSSYMNTEEYFRNTLSFISKDLEPVVLVISLRRSEIFSEGGNVYNIESEFDDMRASGFLTGTARIKNLGDDKILGYFDVSNLSDHEKIMIDNCSDSICDQRKLYEIMLQKWCEFVPQ